MKIYNKKVFASGIFMVSLGGFNLVMSIATKDVDKNAIILIVVLFAFGFGALMRSMSKKMTREDKLKELDERNQFVELKSKSQSFRLTQIITFALMLALLIMGKVSGYEGFITMAAGLAFSFSISMFAEIFTYMYYAAKN